MRNIVDDIAHLMVRAASSREEFAQYAPAISEFLMNQAQIEAYSRHMRVASTTRPHFWRDGLDVWVKVAESFVQEQRAGARGKAKARKKKRQTGDQKAIARKTQDKKDMQKIRTLVNQWKGGRGRRKNIALDRLKGLIRGDKFRIRVKALQRNYYKIRNEQTFKNEATGNEDVKFDSLPKEQQNKITLTEYVDPLQSLAIQSVKDKEKARKEREVEKEEEKESAEGGGKGQGDEPAPERADGEGDAAAPAPSLQKQPKSDQDKIKEFMDNASSETKKRLQKLSENQQMKAIKAIVSMKGGDDEEVPSDTFAAAKTAAAYRRRLDRY